MLHLDMRENVLWHRDRDGAETRVDLAEDAAYYDCVGPIDCLIGAALGSPTTNNSPAELGARTVEILAAAYRSARVGTPERVASVPKSSRA